MNGHSRRTLLLVGVLPVLLFVVGLTVVVIANDGDGDPTAVLADCEPEVRDDHSMARIWNEVLLSAVRLDVPAPTVHARNLFHSSAAMWDAWAAYDPTARGVFVDEDRVDADADTDEVTRARGEAISFAVYRILVQRYLLSPGAEESITRFDQLMADLCLDPAFTETEGDSAAAFGNRIGATILAETFDDGSNEADGYVDPNYQPVNPPLVVAEPGTVMSEPNRWQPLELEVMVAQNGMPLSESVQTFVGSQWGDVTPFALEPSGDDRPALDPGPPPLSGEAATDQAFKDAAVEVIEHSSLLDPESGETIDIGPATMGNAPVGTYDDRGYAENPVTGEPYEPHVVALGDYGRVVAEFWADGPSSETPPGHWNTIANSVTDALDGALRFEGEGPALDPLEWDVKLYLALNGGMHDAAVAAWGSKAYYDYTRPISMIRYMGGSGQSSDPDGPSFHAEGLPLEAGLVEVITGQSSGPGERHEALADHVGEIAVLSWRGTPDLPETEIGGVGWILAVDWVPYQLSTFVTPAFAGYISGHSTFSRTGAEVLTAMTGSEFFPGGLGEWTIPAGSLEFEAGPADDLTLQWATFADASDEAGVSRLYGGIHVRADDLRGREVGFEAGRGAWTLAERYFDGTVDG